VKHINCEQRSEEWHFARLGIPIASAFAKIVTAAKAEPSKQQDDYMNTLLFEWMTGQPCGGPETYAMRMGQEREDEAVQAYEIDQDVETERCGLLTTDDGLIGASPDRWIPKLKIACEIKCHLVAPGIHMRYMRTKDLDIDHRPQVQGQLWVGELDKNHFASYHPDAPLVVIAVGRDEKYIEKLAAGVRAFVDRMLEARLVLEREFGPFERPKRAPAQTGADPGGLGITDEDMEAVIEMYRKEGRL
jgi:hypothetical protein